MKKSNFVVLIILLANLPVLLLSQTIVTQEGDPCHEAEKAYKLTPPDGTFTNYHNYTNCLAEAYLNGELTLFEVYQIERAQIQAVLGDIAWIHCANSSDPNCLTDHMDYLIKLDEDNDGIPNLADPTPKGGATTTSTIQDQDGDGIPDSNDKCKDTPSGSTVNEFGCPQVILTCHTDRPYYFTDESAYIYGTASDPISGQPIQNLQIDMLTGNMKPAFTDEHGIYAFEIIFYEEQEQNYDFTVKTSSNQYSNGSCDGVLKVKEPLSIQLYTNKNSYQIGETMKIFGQVNSPEPIGSDLSLEANVFIYDGSNAQYWEQKVHIRSDGHFEFEKQLYNQSNPGQWYEAGALGNWLILASVSKEGLRTDSDAVLTLVKDDKETSINTRSFDQVGTRVSTTGTEQIWLQRSSQNEALLADRNTDLSVHGKGTNKPVIEVQTGSVLYIKDVDHPLTPSKTSTTSSNYLTVNGAYTSLYSTNSAYELIRDPRTGEDHIKIYQGPVQVSSPTNAFASRPVTDNVYLIVGKNGILRSKVLSEEDMAQKASRFEGALQGINLMDLEHRPKEKAKNTYDDSDPGEWADVDYYTLTFEEKIRKYFPHILTGIFVLIVLIAIFRKKKTKPVEEKAPKENRVDNPSPAQKDDDGWEEVTFCTNCGQALLQGQKFCGECGKPV